MSINLPISIGEALDKLTILDIKLKKITDESRLKFVREEFEELKNHVGSYYDSNKFFYNLLFKINELIWDVQDDLRLNIIPASNEHYKTILDENDRRCRVKNKINSKSLSHMREQKGYPLKKAFVYTSHGLGDIICMIGIIRYLSTSYDRVVVMIKEKYLENVELMLRDDETISFMKCKNDEIPILGDDGKFQEMDTFIYGDNYSKDDNSFKNEDTLEKFYKQLGIDFQIGKEYFFIDELPMDQIIQSILQQQFYFVHDVSELDISRKLLLQNPDLLIINPSRNPYPVDHRFHDLLENIQNKPIVYFIPIIKNAKKIYCIDSLFFNLVDFLDTSKVEQLYCISRGNRKYKLFCKFKYISINDVLV